MDALNRFLQDRWWLALLGAILLCQLAGAVGAVFAVSAIPTWYATLIRPDFSPPNWIFSPVWITLYTLMGIAAALVWKEGWQRPEVRLALVTFAVQLFLNALWSFLFFGLQNPLLGLIDIVLMLTAIVATLISFAQVSRPAALLLIPYLFWVSFATYLNAAIWVLNMK